MRAALVLAGGASRRMGQDKEYLVLPSGVTLGQHVMSALASVCTRRIVVRRSDGHHYPDVEVVFDKEPAEPQGPLQALATGLGALPADALVFVTGIDARFLSESHVRWMFERLESSTRDAVIPYDPERALFHPLCGTYRVGPTLKAAQALVAAGESRLQHLCRALDVERVEVKDLPDPRVVLPCNTPGDLVLA